MKKFIIIISLCITNNAMAKKWVNEASYCFIDKQNKKAFICGDKIPEKCAGKKLKKYTSSLYKSGECFSHKHKDGTANMCCCNGQFSDVSGFAWQKTYRNWYRTEEVILNVQGGTCRYNKEIYACGTVVDKPCTTADNCTEGHMKRNGTCIKNCPDGQAFESETSNTCIDCTATQYQGYYMVDGFKVCKKCDSSIEFFNKENKICIRKSSLTPINNADMKYCGLCPNNETFKNCLKCKLENTCTSELKEQCFIPTDPKEEPQP